MAEISISVILSRVKKLTAESNTSYIIICKGLKTLRDQATYLDTEEARKTNATKFIDYFEKHFLEDINVLTDQQLAFFLDVTLFLENCASGNVLYEHYRVAMLNIYSDFKSLMDDDASKHDFFENLSNQHSTYLNEALELQNDPALPPPPGGERWKKWSPAYGKKKGEPPSFDPVLRGCCG